MLISDVIFSPKQFIVVSMSRFTEYLSDLLYYLGPIYT